MTAIPHPQLLERLQWRYATKQFDASRTIAPDDWAALEEALVLSPSSFGLQPWTFLVVQNPAVRQQLQAASWRQSQVVDASHFVVLTVRTQIDQAYIAAFIAQTAQARGLAPEMLAPYQQMITGSVLQGLDEAGRLAWASRQIYIALGNLLTSAALLGIDACPMEGLDPAAYDRILNLESQGLKTVVACALGYRAETDGYAGLPKVRFTKDQVIRYL